MKKNILYYIIILVVIAVAVSCGSSSRSSKKDSDPVIITKNEGRLSRANRKKIEQIRQDSVKTGLTLPKEKMFSAPEIKNVQRKDTIKVVDFEGKEMFLMNTIKDESGETVANQVLDAAVVTARFRNIAERNGKVDIEFQLIVPEALADSRWQLRYQPTMYVLKDSTKLERVFITGKEYRKKQLRGYEQYNKWLSRIITDSTKFIDVSRLELFLERNIPQVYKFKTDSTFVSDEDFEGFMGVRESEAIEHFTKKYLIRWNDRQVAKKGKMYDKYVKAPFVTEKLRLDTVLNINGNYVYNYVQELDLKGRRRVKKVDIVLEGEVWEQGEKVFDIPRTEPLTFYISSISAFVDGTERYITKVIEKKATANRNYDIDFEVGKYDVLPDFRDNAKSISAIKQQLTMLLSNEKFDLDSVVVFASSSPEGSEAANMVLSRRRSESITDYFDRYMKHQIDSLDREDGLSFNLDETYTAEKKEKRKPIKFISRYEAENWWALHNLVEEDTLMTLTEKEQYYAMADEPDADLREIYMRGEKWYKHIREDLYPRLRSVNFKFNLSRKGMVKDTVHTTEIDSVYMAGVQAIRDRDYELAANLLRDYNDYNAAIAYAALDRNNSALQILDKCEPTAPVKYMKAIIYSRFGDDQKAVQNYMDACNMDSQFIFRGNLDPEISVLIKRYELNKQDEEEFLY